MPEPDDESIIHELITIVGNLIDNALDAVMNCERKQVHVSIHYQDKLIITVQDTGNGIRKDEIDKVFVKGYSTKGENRGYGLYLVNDSLKQINGNIHVDSLLGKGTTITIEIPYKSRDEIGT